MNSFTPIQPDDDEEEEEIAQGHSQSTEEVPDTPNSVVLERSPTLSKDDEDTPRFSPNWRRRSPSDAAANVEQQQHEDLHSPASEGNKQSPAVEKRPSSVERRPPPAVERKGSSRHVHIWRKRTDASSTVEKQQASAVDKRPPPVAEHRQSPAAEMKQPPKPPSLPKNAPAIIFKETQEALRDRIRKANDDMELKVCANTLLDALSVASRTQSKSITTNLPKTASNLAGANLYATCWRIYKAGSKLCTGSHPRGRQPYSTLAAAKTALTKALDLLYPLQRKVEQASAKDTLANESNTQFLAKFRSQVQSGAYWGGLDTLPLWRLHDDNPLKNINVTVIEVGQDGAATFTRTDCAENRRQQAFLFHTRYSDKSHETIHWEPIGKKTSKGTQFLFESVEPQAEEGMDLACDENLRHAIQACKRRVLEKKRAPEEMRKEWGPSFEQSDNDSEARRFFCAETKEGICWFSSWSLIVPNWSLQEQRRLLIELSRSHPEVVAKEIRLGNESVQTIRAMEAEAAAKAKQRMDESKKESKAAAVEKVATMKKTKTVSRGVLHTPVISEDSKVIAWKIQREIDSPDKLVQNAQSRGVTIPRPASVYIKREFRPNCYHHIILFQSKQDAAAVIHLAPKLRSALGWGLRAFQDRANKTQAVKELLKSATNRATSVCVETGSAAQRTNQSAHRVPNGSLEEVVQELAKVKEAVVRLERLLQSQTTGPRSERLQVEITRDDVQPLTDDVKSPADLARSSGALLSRTAGPPPERLQVEITRDDVEPINDVKSPTDLARSSGAPTDRTTEGRPRQGQSAVPEGRPRQGQSAAPESREHSVPLPTRQFGGGDPLRHPRWHPQYPSPPGHTGLLPISSIHSARQPEDWDPARHSRWYPPHPYEEPRPSSPGPHGLGGPYGPQRPVFAQWCRYGAWCRRGECWFLHPAPPSPLF
jgi:hypothetical protein